jgi:glycosyltransferase involved in cell wall biosynthesis
VGKTVEDPGRVTPPSPVLYVHHRSELGGAPGSLAQLIERIDRTRHRPYVFCPPGPAADLFRAAGATVITGTVSSFTHIWASTYHGRRWLLFARELARLPVHLVELRRVLRAEKFALVHLNDSPLIPAAFLAHRHGVPVVWHLRSSLPPYPSAKSRFVRGAVRRRASASIAINDDVAASFDIGAETIPNGIDLERFSPGAAEPAREALGLETDVPVVTYVGFLYPYKGFREFLRAAALIRERGVEARFLIVGGAVRDAAFFRGATGRLLARLGFAHDYDREARELVQELLLEPAVTFVPYTREMPAVYRASAIVVAPSQGPELGRPVLEAAASGRPVVASGSRGGGGLLIPGETGLIADPGTPERLAEAVGELLADPARCERLGRAARRHAETSFEVGAIVGRVEVVYSGILER